MQIPLVSHPDLWAHLSKVDIFIIAFFALSFLLLPHIVRNNAQQQEHSDANFLLMGRALGLPLFVATLTSTWYGGIFGVTQIAFEKGFYSFFTQGLFWYISYLIFALFFAKKIRQRQVLSLPELLGQRFGQKARRVSALILFFHALPVTYAISIGILIQMIFVIDFSTALIIGVGLVAIYTSLGGFRGVVLTDALQFLLMFSAVIMCLSFLLLNFGFMDFLEAKLPQSYFNWRGEQSLASSLIWLFIACSTTLIHPVFYQRCLAAKNDSVAIYGIFVAVFCWLIFDCCTTLGGMYAKALIPDAPSEKAYVSLALQLLPEGLRGFFLAGILATILSTLDSFLFVSGTSLSYDLIPHRANDQRKHQLAIVLSAGLVISVALAFKLNFEEIWLFMEGVFSTALVVPVMLALFYKRALSFWHFILPLMAALSVYGFGSWWRLSIDASFSPFYWAHLASLASFAICSLFLAKRTSTLINPIEKHAALNQRSGFFQA